MNQPTSTLLTSLLPPQARSAEAFEDTPGVLLHPEEEAVIAKAVDKRRREFTTVRHCARQALSALGRPAGPLVPGLRGAPVWPRGVVGSLTHCEGYRACAVALGAEVVSLGIDAEPHAPLPEGVLDAIARPREQRQVARLASHFPARAWDRLLFSAKESVYKTWFPLTGQPLDFQEAELDLDPERRTFHARLLSRGHDHEGRLLETFEGRWRIERGLIVTAIAHQP
ncbi:4'-phosphopantetheinyl transferase [Streptomyces sp. NPDC007088]|uniref:4'-phosphopantetheinyl transferase family protein n=1 Tax=Streptomyces sp. NPDC007088 TaxID=3364773 RepID=UPI0036852A2B